MLNRVSTFTFKGVQDVSSKKHSRLNSTNVGKNRIRIVASTDRSLTIFSPMRAPETPPKSAFHTTLVGSGHGSRDPSAGGRNCFCFTELIRTGEMGSNKNGIDQTA